MLLVLLRMIQKNRRSTTKIIDALAGIAHRILGLTTTTKAARFFVTSNVGGNVRSLDKTAIGQVIEQ